MPDLILIPVYRGGRLWLECLESWKSVAHLIPAWVVSINGARPESDVDALHETGFLDRTNVEILVTRQDLTLPAHLSFITRSSSKIKEESIVNVMFWSCDDTVHPGNFVDFFSNLSPRYKRSSAVFGEWRTSDAPTDQQRRRKSLWRYFPAPKETVLRSIRSMQVRPGASSSVTGVVVPRQGLVDAVNYMSSFKAGVAIEHVLITHQSVKNILSCPLPYATIHYHDNQVQRTTTPSRWRHDELLYLVWLFRQNRLIELQQILYALLKIFKILVRSPFLTIVLIRTLMYCRVKGTTACR